MLVGSHGVDVAWHAGNGARRDPAFRDPVALVIPIRGHPGASPVAIRTGNKFAAIDDRVEVQIFRVDAEPAFRQQQVAKHQPRALEAVDEVEHFGNQLEAVGDVQRRGNRARIISECRAEHLPQVALLGFRRNARRWPRALTINDHDGSFDHRGHPQALAHQCEPAPRRGAHRTHAPVSGANRHVDHANLVFHLPDHDPGLARVRRHPVQHAGRRTHGIRTIKLHARCRASHGHGDVAA